MSFNFKVTSENGVLTVGNVSGVVPEGEFAVNGHTTGELTSLSVYQTTLLGRPVLSAASSHTAPFVEPTV